MLAENLVDMPYSSKIVHVDSGVEQPCNSKRDRDKSSVAKTKTDTGMFYSYNNMLIVIQLLETHVTSLQRHSYIMWRLMMNMESSPMMSWYVTSFFHPCFSLVEHSLCLGMLNF